MKFQLKFVFLLQSFVLSFSVVYAADFYSINALHGISLREVNSVTSDKYGFIWASSNMGILRLTEDSYRMYQLPYQNSNVINVKLNNQGQSLIAYTNNGQFFRYNELYDRFDLFLDIVAELQNRYLVVKTVQVDENGVWIATANGIYCYNLKQLKLVFEIRLEIYSMTKYGKDQLLVAKDDGLWVLNTKTGTYGPIYKYTIVENLKVSSLYYDKDNNYLWIGTKINGLFRYNLSTSEFSPILTGTIPRQPILDIEKLEDASILIGIDGKGIWKINSSGTQVAVVYKEQIDDPKSLKGNGVYDLYNEGNNRVWVGTYSGGLSFFNQSSPLVQEISHKANNINSLINNDVNKVIEDRRGKIWFATNNGVSVWDKVTDKWTHLYNGINSEKVFLSLCEDDKGRIWAGSYSAGLYILDGKTGRELHHYNSKSGNSTVIGDFIFEIYKDSEGDIWIGGETDEVVCYLSKEDKFRTYSREPVRKIIEKEPNQILWGCSYGLILLDKISGVSTRLFEGVSLRDLLVLNNVIWICTGGDGLIKYDTDNNKIIEKYTKESGLPSNFVNSIVFDGKHLWLGTETGICRYNPTDNSFVTYPSIYSLSQTSFNNNANCKLSNGQIAWGTNKGAIMFDPNTIREAPFNGSIYFQDIAISGRSIRTIEDFNYRTPIDSLSELELNHYQNNINLELIPLQAAAGAKFSWKLEGFDKEWSVPSEHRVINYTNIPNGDFVLQVRLYDSSLSTIIAERQLSLTVIPPFWKTLWFWSIVYTILISLALLVLKLYLKSVHQKHTEDKVRFFTNTAHDIRTSLTLVKGPVEDLVHEKNLSVDGAQNVNLAIEQVRRLSSVVTQLMDFQKVDVGKEHLSLGMVDVIMLLRNRIAMFSSIAKIHKIDIVFGADCERYETAIDEVKIEKVVDNLISNAIKYSRAGNKVLVDFTGNDNSWSVQITDFGIGIHKEAQGWLFKEFFRGENAINSKIVGSGIGLLLVKDYVNLHDGKVHFTSEENVGSKFSITIPFKLTEEPVSRLNRTENNVVAGAQADEMIDIAGLIDSESEGGEPEFKILVVEDNEDLVAFMNRTLSREFKVYTAENGAKAMEIVDSVMPDLIVSDIMMPEMDGFELCQRLKTSYETSHIPVILLTALSEKTEQLKGLGIGADDYLTKPFDMSLLIQRIKSIIRNRSIIREKAFRLIKGDVSEPILNNELNDKFMKRLLEVAKANVANTGFNKDEFASAMNVSTSLLYKKVKSLTNLSPSDLIKVVRLDYALELLQSRKYTVTDVSEMCGFASVGYFSTVFKKHFNKSPSDILES